MKAIQWYVTGGAYELNAQLRRGEQPDSPEAKKILGLLHGAKPCQIETRLYRGLDFHYDIPDVELGIMDTSTSEEVALGFVHSRVVDDRNVFDGHLLILDVQPGVKMLDIGGVQQEVLLESGVKITETRRCVSEHKRGGIITYVWYEVRKNV